VKIFVLENGGYLSIRQTQANFFGRLTGESVQSGVSFPDMARIAAAYGIPAVEMDCAGHLDGIAALLETPGPSLAVIHLDPSQEFEPRLKSRQLPDGTLVSPNLEDMYPFLDAGELESNLLIGQEAAQ
ncbi:MAG TPA: thiamine pyrophosphate-dependent enzyme, partial [Bryobacteraceae bacterium]|nr:thiamine pyrophosphate-dependent enzyme [Bryobacteraceae bacterium]